jgi:SAM-dependent methyltransferase
MSGPFFGELYLRSTRPFLSNLVNEAEARFLKTNLSPGRWLDVGCGHGRHLQHLGGFGVDRDPTSLHEARTFGGVAQADFTALPFRAASFDGAWCWYNSLGTLEDDVVPRVLAEVARVLKPGAVFIIQGTNLERARAQPDAGFDGPLASGDYLKESARFDAARRRDVIHRALALPNGRLLEADFFIRYYEFAEWRSLLEEAGFEVRWVVGGIDGMSLEIDSTDVIVGSQRRSP